MDSRYSGARVLTTGTLLREAVYGGYQNEPVRGCGAELNGDGWRQG